MESLYMRAIDDTKSIDIKKEYYEDLEDFYNMYRHPDYYKQDNERVTDFLDQSAFLKKLIHSENIRLYAIALANGRCDVAHQRQLASVLFGIIYGLMYRTNLSNKGLEHSSSEATEGSKDAKIKELTEQVNRRGEELDTFAKAANELKEKGVAFNKRIDDLTATIFNIEKVNTDLRKDIERLNLSLSKATESKSTNVLRPTIPHLPLKSLHQPFPNHSFNHSSTSKFQSTKSSVHPPMDEFQLLKSSTQPPLKSSTQPPLKSSTQPPNPIATSTYTSQLLPMQLSIAKTNLEKYLEAVKRNVDLNE